MADFGLWEAVEAYSKAMGGDRKKADEKARYEAMIAFSRALGLLIAHHRDHQEEMTRREAHP